MKNKKITKKITYKITYKKSRIGSVVVSSQNRDTPYNSNNTATIQTRPARRARILGKMGKNTGKTNTRNTRNTKNTREKSHKSKKRCQKIYHFGKASQDTKILQVQNKDTTTRKHNNFARRVHVVCMSCACRVCLCVSVCVMLMHTLMHTLMRARVVHTSRIRTYTHMSVLPRYILRYHVAKRKAKEKDVSIS